MPSAALTAIYGYKLKAYMIDLGYCRRDCRRSIKFIGQFEAYLQIEYIEYKENIYDDTVISDILLKVSRGDNNSILY
jgi:hypothetical protein